MSAGRTARTPLHEQVHRALRERIDSGELPEGAQLPTELEVADEFDVSRGTARQAISRLTHEGLVERAAGRGTFVSSRRLTYAARELLGFTAQIRAAGRTPSSELVGIDVVDLAGSGYAVDFGTVERVLVVERVRLADDEPVALEHLLLPYPRFAGLHEIDLANVSIYDTLEEQFGVRLRVGDFTLDVEDLSQRQAQLLGDPPGTPAFLMSGVVSDQDGAPIVSVRAAYRRSRYSFRFQLPRGPVGAGQDFSPPRLVLV